MTTDLALDLPHLVDLCRTEDPDLVANTREESLRRAAYLRGRDAGQVVAALMTARVVEWEMAHRWPANKSGAHRGDDRPPLDASNGDDREAWQRIYAVGAQDFDWITSRTEPEQLTQAAIIRGPAHTTNATGNPEWYTPAPFLDAARACMGSIDLDPASSDVAQVTVRAERFFTAEDDGLAQPWAGNVWLNPPYSQPLVGGFIAKLVAEHRAGNVPRAVVLVNNATETAFGQMLLGASVAACFPAGRLRFLDPEGNPGAPLQGQMIAYLDEDGKRDPFEAEFARFGVVL